MKKQKIEVTVRDEKGNTTFYESRVVTGDGPLKIQLPHRKIKSMKKMLRLNQTVH